LGKTGNAAYYDCCVSDECGDCALKQMMC